MRDSIYGLRYGMAVCVVMAGISGGMSVYAAPAGLAPVKKPPADYTYAAEDNLFEKAAIGSPADVRLLLEEGADPNSLNKYKQTPLAVVIDRNDENTKILVKLLLKYGADPNKAELKDYYPIILAIRNEQPEILHMLLESGADYNVTDEFGYTTFDVAESTSNATLLHILQHRKQVDEDKAAYLKSIEYLEEQVERFAFVSCANAYLINHVTAIQDSLTPEAKKAYEKQISEQEKAIEEQAKHIMEVTEFPAKKLREVAVLVREKIHAELDDMVTVDYRKNVGVGTDQDIQERCQEIATLVERKPNKKGRKVKKDGSGFFWK